MANTIATPPERAGTLLGCGQADVFVTYRGGQPQYLETAAWKAHTLVGQMLYTGLQYNTPLSETGQLELTLDGVSGVVGGYACCAMLLNVEPWEHEIVVVRNGIVTFQGPIVQIVYDPDKVTIRARDLSAWFDKRAVHQTLGPYNVTAGTLADASTILLAAARSALDPDVSPQIGGLNGGSTPTGSYPAGYTVNQAEDKNSGQTIRDLAKMGPDWIVKHKNRTFYSGWTGSYRVHNGDHYGFQNGVFDANDTSSWSVSGGSLSITTYAGNTVMAWTIPSNGTFTLSTTLRNLKVGRPHNFIGSVSAGGVAAPPITAAYAVIGYYEQGPDYTVPLAMPSNAAFAIVQAAGQPGASEVDYTFHVETTGPVTLYLDSFQTQEYLPVMVLNDEAFASPPSVVFDGLQQVNRQIVHGAGEGQSGAAIVGEAPLPAFPSAPPWPTLTAEQLQYGLLEDVEQQQTITDSTTANRAALSRYLLLFRAPRTITGGKLAATAAFAADARLPIGQTGASIVQFDVSDLLPGNYVFVQLDRYCVPVGDYFRISNVEYAYPGGNEEITLTLIPPRDL